MKKLEYYMIIFIICGYSRFVNCKSCSIQTTTCPLGWIHFNNQRGCYYLPPPVTGSQMITITSTLPLFLSYEVTEPSKIISMDTNTYTSITTVE